MNNFNTQVRQMLQASAEKALACFFRKHRTDENPTLKGVQPAVPSLGAQVSDKSVQMTDLTRSYSVDDEFDFGKPAGKVGCECYPIPGAEFISEVEKECDYSYGPAKLVFANDSVQTCVVMLFTMELATKLRAAFLS